MRQEGAVVVVEEEEEGRWARLLPELLAEVLRRVEVSGGERWPARKDVVSCACVCRRWRDAAATVVRPLPESGKITFLASLKQVRNALPPELGSVHREASIAWVWVLG